jgi:hypothetical protein
MKLWHSFVKELQLSSKSWYFYIEVGMAVILLLILLFVIPKETDSRTDEYLYAGDLPSDYTDLIYRGILDEEDEDEEYERVEIEVGGDVFGADLFVTDTRNIFFVDDLEAVIKLAEEEKKIGVTLDTGSKIITLSRTATLLGFKIHKSMSFSKHLMDGKDSLIKTLNKQIGALK